MFRRISVVVAILMVSGTTAQAEDDDYARSGPYIGAAGTWAIWTQAEDELEDEGLVSVDVENPLGVNARAGYRMHPYLAAEMQFEWLSESNIEASGLDIAGLDSWVLTANAKGYILTLLMNDFGIARVQPFALVGVGMMQSEFDDKVGLDISDKDESFAARFGGGIDLYITPNILGSVDVTYVLPGQDLFGLDYVSFGWGLQYRF